MGYRKFRSLLERNDEQGMTEFLEKKFLKNNGEQSNCNYEDYTILKDLIKHGKKDLMRKCIEKGFPVNIDIKEKSFEGTPLHLAVLSRCPETVQLLLDNGASIYKNNGNSETPLLLSVISGNDQITDILLSRIEPKEYFSDENISHFHIACIRNHVKLVHQFLMSGTDIHQPVGKVSQFWPGYTPLHFAVQYRSTETVELLVKSGADVTIKNKHGSTPVHLAYRVRDKKIINILLSAQCFHNQNPTDRVARSHFHIACAADNVVAIKGFIEKELHYSGRVQLYESNTYPHKNALCYAIDNDCFDVLEHLLTSEDWFLKFKSLRIIDDAHEKGSPEVINLIVSCFEKNMVDFQCRYLVENYSSKKKESSTTIQSTVQSNSSNTQEHFERYEVSQQTKLHVAVLKKDRSSVTSILKTHPSAITMKDARGQTPLHLAFQTKQTEIIQNMLNIHLKINDNPVDSNGLSHFHIACTTEHMNIIKDFLKKGADVDSVVKMDSPVWAGFNPLHFAVWFEQIEVARLLLKYGANYAAKNAAKMSPFDLAIPGVRKQFQASVHLDYDSMDDECSSMMDFEDYESDDDDRDDGSDDWDLVTEILIENDKRKIYGFDDRGITHLHLTAMFSAFPRIGYYASQTRNINKRTDLNLPKSCAGFTPLHFAVAYDKKKAANTLWEYGADVTIQNVKKEAVAHICDKKWFRETVGCRLLLGSKNVRNEHGVSLFHLACRNKSIEAVKHFLKMKVDVNEPIDSESQNQGKTALHLAVEADSSEIVKLLLDHGANVNARDRYFETPIAFSKSKQVFNMLLASRADLLALTYEYKTALHRVLYKSKDRDFLSAVATDKRCIGEVVRTVFVDNLQNSAKISLLKYFQSRIKLGIELNFQTQHVYNELRRYIGLIKQRPGDLSHEKKCAIEITLLKGIEIDEHTTLYDVLLKSSTEMARYSKNETFQKIVESGDLRKNYPIYASSLVLQFNRGRKRTVLIKKAKKSLNVLANRSMGNQVLENILQFLNDYEIQYLIYATSGQNILDRKF